MKTSTLRKVSLAGGAAGGLIGYLFADRWWHVVAGVVLGMVLAPFATGASPRQVGGALFLPVRRR